MRRARSEPDPAPDGAGHVARQAEHVLGSGHCRLNDTVPDRRDHRAERRRAGNRHGRPEDGIPACDRSGIRHTTTNRLLVEAGFGGVHAELERTGAAGERSRADSRDRTVHERLSRTTATSRAWSIARRTGIPTGWRRYRWNASATYVTGAHNMKVGYVGAYYWIIQRPSTNNYNLAYRFNDGVPNQITENLNPWEADARVAVQRVLSAGPVDPGQADAPRGAAVRPCLELVPAAADWPDAVPPDAARLPGDAGRDRVQRHRPADRRGVRPVRKREDGAQVQRGRYLEAAVGNNGNYSSLQPVQRIATSVTRSWTDANGNYTPDCDLANGSAQDLRTSGGDFCGALEQSELREERLLAVVRRADPQGLGRAADPTGSSARRSSTSCSRASRSRSATRGAGSRTSRSPTTAPRRAADFTPFSITAPLDPRLPGGGGYVVSGLYDVVPAKFNAVDNYRTYAPNYGTISQMYNGVEINVAARLEERPPVSGRQRHRAACDGLLRGASEAAGADGGVFDRQRASRVQSDEPLLPLRAGVRHATHRRRHLYHPEDRRAGQRRADEQPRAFRCGPTGPCRAPSWRSRSAGPLAGSVANVTVNLLKPDDMRSDRVNQLDLRVAKILRLRPDAGEHRARLVQRVEPGHDHLSKPGVRPGRGVAGADGQGQTR